MGRVQLVYTKLSDRNSHAVYSLMRKHEDSRMMGSHEGCESRKLVILGVVVSTEGPRSLPVPSSSN